MTIGKRDLARAAALTAVVRRCREELENAATAYIEEISQRGCDDDERLALDELHDAVTIAADELGNAEEAAERVGVTPEAIDAAGTT